jgi:hypothetical protein
MPFAYALTFTNRQCTTDAECAGKYQDRQTNVAGGASELCNDSNRGCANVMNMNNTEDIDMKVLRVWHPRPRRLPYGWG